MLLEALFTYMAGKTAVTDLIGNRLYKDHIDEGETSDCADMRIVASNHAHHLQGLAGMATSIVVFDCYSMHRETADAIAFAMMFTSQITRQKGLVGSTDIRGVRLIKGPVHDTEGPVPPGSDDFRCVTSFTLEIDWATPHD